MAYFNNINNFNSILVIIYCFVDDFIKGIIKMIKYSLQRPGKNMPPIKKYKLCLAELITLAIFRFFTGHSNWKKFYQFIVTYHAKDFPNLPTYQNFVYAVNKLSCFASMMLTFFMNFFKKITPISKVKFVDSTKLKVCENKREFSHKTCK
jgi:hypothetical protein